MPVADNADLVLYYAPQSRAVTALRLMEELERPYRLEVIDLNRGDQKKPEFLARNPMGKVPLVLDGDIAIAETGAIFAYLADKYAAGRLAPLAGAPERADYLRWLFFAAGVMEPAFGEKFFKWNVPSRSVGWGSFGDMLSTVTNAVARSEWLAGRFSAADIYVASTLRYGMLFGIIEKGGPLADYVARWVARPASERAAAIDARHAPKPER